MGAHVLVTGAGGFVGSRLISELHRAGYEVICCGRDEARLRLRFPFCQVVECDFAQPPSIDVWKTILRDVSVVINAAGIIQEHGASTFDAVHRDSPITLFHAAERAGVRRVIQISALGADAKAETRYHRTKKAADDALRSLSLDWVIIQPSLVYGSGGRSHVFFAAIAALPLVPLPGQGDQPIQPIHIDDLVQGILHLMRPEAPGRVTLAAVGPEPVTFGQYMETIRAWLGLRVGPVASVPMGLVRLVAQIGTLLRSEFVTADTLSMLCQGNMADPTPFAKATGVTPRLLTGGLPAAGAMQSERQAASLYFLRPLLRISIAAVWVGSGVVSLFFFPRETSEGWLVRVGIPPAWTGLALIMASIVDIGLGLATLVRWRPTIVLGAQLVLILGFSAFLTARMPEWWTHPFGPLLKNLPLFVGTLLLWAWERRS